MTERLTLAGQVAMVASAEEGIESVMHEAETTWLAAGVPFAIVAGDVVELKLDQPIAEAATRTPDTEFSPRGPEWVRFHPRELDQHAIDRLAAWFALARRRATSAAARGS
jgi:hypothetical protein